MGLHPSSAADALAVELAFWNSVKDSKPPHADPEGGNKEGRRT